MTETHAHEHTSHSLRTVIEALPRYAPTSRGVMKNTEFGGWVKLDDVRAVVHKAATLGAPVAHKEEME